jgi:hypothetical protein
MEITESLVRRFWVYASKGDPEQCWEWQGALRAGYGCLRHNQKVVNCHRVSYVIHNGPVPDGLIVGHKCDNRRCVNPHHLEAITYAQNNYDGAHRGREKRGVKAPCGTDFAHAKLTESIVSEARRIRAEQGYGWRRISKMLQVAEAFALREALAGRTWKHVPMESAATSAATNGVAVDARA